DATQLYSALVRAKRSRRAYFAPPADLPELLRIVVDRLGGWHQAMSLPDAEVWFRLRDLAPAVILAAGTRGVAALGRFAGATIAPPSERIALEATVEHPPAHVATPRAAGRIVSFGAALARAGFPRGTVLR